MVFKKQKIAARDYILPDAATRERIWENLKVYVSGEPKTLARVYMLEIIDIACRLLSRVSQKIVVTKWRIYKCKISSPQDILCKSKR